MAQVHFTSWLREIVPDGPLNAAGATVGDVLAAVFAQRPNVRGYVLDDQGGLRKHMTILVDGQRIRDVETLSDAVRPDSEVWVMQALSGG